MKEIAGQQNEAIIRTLDIALFTLQSEIAASDPVCVTETTDQIVFFCIWPRD